MELSQRKLMRICCSRYSVLVLNIVQIQLTSGWKNGEKLEVSRIRNRPELGTSNMVESRHYLYHCADWSLHPGGVKTGELLHTSQSQDGVRWRFTFYDRITTPECSEDRKWALCMHTCVNAPHTHFWRTAKLSDQTHKHWIEKNRRFVYIFVQTLA